MWGEGLYFLEAAAGACAYGSISLVRKQTWIARDVVTRTFVPAPQRAVDHSSRFRPGDLSGALAAPPPGAALHAAHRRVFTPSRAHDAAARQPQGGEGIRAEAWRLDCGAAQTLAGGCSVCAWDRCTAAGNIASHRSPSRRTRHGVDGSIAVGRSVAVRRRRARTHQ